LARTHIADNAAAQGARMIKATLALALFALPGIALAQAPQPYAGLQQRPVKALSEQQVADLKAGRGMGLALPAELNGYPGPSHALEHADALELTVEQRQRTKALFDAMKSEAIPVGERLIKQETVLDQLFAMRMITPASLRTATAEIGATQASLRETHLKYHLAMMELLTTEQVEKYRTLRGYGTGAGRTSHPHRHN
jgi:Spy/CpxP family protein refolding chaperone